APAAPRSVGGTRTADGYPVELLGNVGDAAGAAEVAACEADGIGLFRTELAFRTRTRQPSIEVQARLYSSVLAEVPERKA
ncbi:phosphoenolpyruvate--protein phosphotransferase, partial [Mycobacterium tuberculosis]|nr:phosphoenolpyruvate--protein phosphotransferase [Mycobacterium tuberculosis]